MDLMSGSTTYSVLEKKYNNFKAPSCEIKVGSTKLLSGKDLFISELEVELTSGFEASGCRFEICAVYNPEKSDFSSDVSCLAIGEKLEIEVGYVKRESVFNGYISDIKYSFSGSSISITVLGMDAKGALMKSRRMEFFTEKTANAIVNKILGESPVSNYISGKVVDSCSEDEVPLRSHQMTDYELIVEQAQKNGFEFFILQGKAYFRKRKKVKSSIMTLEPGEALISANVTYSGQKLVNEFEIRSIDQEKGEMISGSASISGSFGKSKSKLLGKSKQIFYEPGVKDANEAKARATARAEEAAESFGELTANMVGIPEIVPGRFIKVKKLADAVNGSYYINYVRHIIDEGGFYTEIRASRNSL